MNVANHWEDIWWSHPSKMSPNNLGHLRKNESMKMRISTKPLYKLFSVVHNYFLWMCLIIERIYDDRIAQNAPKNLENLRENESMKMRIYTKPLYKLFSVVHNYFLCIFQIIEDLWWSYAQNNLEKLRKTGNLKMWISTKSCYKLFSVVHNYFLWFF